MTVPTLNTRFLPPPELDFLTQRGGHHSLGVFSPVNETGSFEFDRVIKSGTALKRSKRTNNWKPVRLVLRPNLLSVYKDENETKLRHQLNLSEVTSLALRRHPKRKEETAGGFCIFVPYRNFYFEAETDLEAKRWLELLQVETNIEVNNVGPKSAPTALPMSGSFSSSIAARISQDRQSSTSPEPGAFEGHATSQPLPIRTRPITQDTNYVQEPGSFSDMSDGVQRANMGNWSPISHGRRSIPPTPVHGTNVRPTNFAAGLTDGTYNASQISVLDLSQDEERVIWHGFLYGLKSRGGMRQWKKYWAVLRPKHLALYKNEHEYSVNLLLPVSSMLDVVEIDPIAKNKEHCMQIICEEKNYRFSAMDEQSLSRWLGNIKLLLEKKKEKRALR